MVKVEDITGNEELWSVAMRQNCVEWGGKLAPERYLRANRKLHDILVGAGMRLDVFAAMEGNEVVGACQVLSRPLYRGGGSISEDHCVAYVFVPKQHRRKGYAKLLVDHAVGRYANSDDLVTLWSDVGAYYERSGFRFAPSLDPSVPIHSTILCTSKLDDESEIEWLGLADMPLLVEDLRQLVTGAVDRLQREAQGTRKYAAVLPTPALFEQLQKQTPTDLSSRGLEAPTKFGARALSGRGCISWTYQFAFKQLSILSISGSADEIALLLGAAAHAASAYPGLKVELYESQIMNEGVRFDDVVSALKARSISFEVYQRKKHLPMSVGDMEYAYPNGYGFF